jgi:DNA-binding XRE family transcriptional regulator
MLPLVGEWCAKTMPTFTGPSFSEKFNITSMIAPGRQARSFDAESKNAAQRASISRTTLAKIEKGDPGVALGRYAPALFVMGMVERLADLADLKNDAVGLQLEEEHLPQRIRGAQKQKRTRGE